MASLATMCIIILQLMAGVLLVHSQVQQQTTNIYLKTGNVLHVADTNDVVVNPVIATSFIVGPCLALSSVSGSNAKKCVSLTPVNKPGWYVRHYGYYLSIEPIANPRNPNIFNVDASFLLQNNLYFSGFHSFESVNYPDRFIQAMTDRRMMINPTLDTTSFKKSSSFAFDETDASCRTTNIYLRTGSVLQVAVTNDVVVTSVIATTFILTPCIAFSKVNSSDVEKCVSLTPVNKPGWYVRHYDYYLSVEPIGGPRNPSIFDIDASFLIRNNLHFIGFHSLESVNYPGYFIRAMTDGRVMISPREDTTAFKGSSTFAFDKTEGSCS